MPANRLAGKLAVITGGARGLGAAKARLFVEHGAQVILSDIEVEDGERLAGELGPAATFLKHDVGDEAAWSEVVDRVRHEHGRLDVLVNNAGINRPMPFLESSVDDMDALYRVNVRGVFLGMHTVAPLMKASGGGSIINVASLAALKSIPNMLAYGTTKWAVRGMTKNAALELAEHGIRVNAIYPGVIDTPMLAAIPLHVTSAYIDSTPLCRLGLPRDVANMALFLASDESDFVTAGDFPVDGGLAL